MVGSGRLFLLTLSLSPLTGHLQWPKACRAPVVTGKTLKPLVNFPLYYRQPSPPPLSHSFTDSNPCVVDHGLNVTDCFFQKPSFRGNKGTWLGEDRIIATSHLLPGQLMDGCMGCKQPHCCGHGQCTRSKWDSEWGGRERWRSTVLRAVQPKMADITACEPTKQSRSLLLLLLTTNPL